MQEQLYVARVDLGRGCGSWHVDSDPDEAVIGVVNRAYRDWRSMFELDAESVTVELFRLQPDGSEEWDGRTCRTFPDHRIVDANSLEPYRTELEYISKVIENGSKADGPRIQSSVDEADRQIRRLHQRLDYAENKGVPEELKGEVDRVRAALFDAEDAVFGIAC